MNQSALRHIGLLLALACCSLTAKAQLSDSTAYAKPQVSVALTGGYTIPNSGEYKYVASYNYGMDVTIDWKMPGTSYWQRFWKRPRFGILMSYLHSANAIAGERFGIAGTMQNTIWQSRRQDPRSLVPRSGVSTIAWTMDAGVSIYTNPYERTGDESNAFIGSYLNCLFNVGLLYSVSLPHCSTISLAAKFGHSSNGYLMRPNRGLNYAQLALSYRMPNKRISMELQPQLLITKPSAYHYIYLSYAPAVVQSRFISPQKPYYYAYTGQFGWLCYLNPCIGFGVNMDLMYNYSHQEPLALEQGSYRTPLYLGVCGTFAPKWGPMSLRLSVGTYLLKSSQVTIPVYERIGVYYNFCEKVPQFVGVSIKAHAAHADYIEWHYGIGFKVHQKGHRRDECPAGVQCRPTSSFY